MLQFESCHLASYSAQNAFFRQRRTLITSNLSPAKKICLSGFLPFSLAHFLQRDGRGIENESLDPKQLELLLAGIEALSAPASVAEKPAPTRITITPRPVRQPLPAHLESKRVVLEPAEMPQPPAGRRKLGEEVTEELDWKPAQFLRRLPIRPKYANTERIVIAPLPARLIEQGLPGAALLTQVIVGKHEGHLPLCRQEKTYHERHGVNLSRTDLVRLEGSRDGLARSALPGDGSRSGRAGLLAGRRNADPLP